MNQVNLCSAKCVAHKDELYTFVLKYPRYIHSEFMTHRVFSRNASSSRAIPVEKIIKEVRDNPVIPPYVYMNCPGMVGKEPATPEVKKQFEILWNDAATLSAILAKGMAEAGVHKQHINRILEPFSYISVVVTATEWDNFFKLRLAPDAQPEMQDLAKAIKLEMEEVKDKTIACWEDDEGTQHYLPFVTQEDVNTFGLDEKVHQISVARCARTSYNNHDGSNPDSEKDLKLFERLRTREHLSPMENPCVRLKGDTRAHANLRHGWMSYRSEYYSE